MGKRPYGPYDGEREPDPTAMNEVVETILQEIPENELRELATKEEDDLIDLHFGLGTWIRNRFKLWENEDLLGPRGVIHPDDVSSKIILEVWKRAREKFGL